MDQSALRLLCENFYYSNKEKLNKTELIAKFREFGVPKSSAYRYYSLLNSGNEKIIKNGPGRPEIRLTNRLRSKVKRLTDKKIFPGYRSIARAIGHSAETAKKIVEKCNVKVCSRKTVPKISPKQVNVQVERLPKLSKLFYGRIVVMDDESYFDLDGHSFFGGRFFSYSEGLEEVPFHIRYIEKAKFGAKLLIWMAISELGASEPYFHECKGAMNADIYINYCIKDKLVPFLNKHGNKKTAFWPDLASSHYAKLTVETYQQLKINFIPKDSNPPAVPMLRPIETFWSNLKAKVYANGFKAENVGQLKSRIRSKLKEFDSDYFKRLMNSVKPKVKTAIDNGIHSLV